MSARGDGYIAAASSFPNFFQLLTDYDKVQYGCLRVALGGPMNKNQRNKRVETFVDSLAAIKAFCIRGDYDDWKRCLVCGVSWLGEDIAINTRQLRLLIFKCKSSINGSLLKMGFNITVGRTETAQKIARQFPVIRDNTPELRQWTIRRRVEVEPEEEAEPVVCADASMEAVDGGVEGFEDDAQIDSSFQNYFEVNSVWQEDGDLLDACSW